MNEMHSQNASDFEMVDDAVAQSAYRRMHPRDGDVVDAMIVAGISLVIILFLGLGNSSVFHWFLVPTFLGGVLMGKEVVACARGKLDVFDPKVIIGALGYNFFFLSSVVYVYADHFDAYFGVLNEDWPHWFGVMGIINILGILLYLLMQRVGLRGVPRSANIYRHTPLGVNPVLISLALLSIVSWLIYYISVGGYKTIAYQRDLFMVGSTRRVFRFYGPLMVFGESAPLLLFIGLTVMRRGWQTYSRKRNTVAWVIIVLLMVFQVLLSGLLGSRGRIFWALFAMVGIVHYFWRPIKLRHVILSLIPVFLLSYGLSFYKDFGSELFDVFRGVPLEHFTHRTDRTGSSIVIGDLSRSLIQAHVARKVLTRRKGEYDLRLGKTYIFALTGPIPGWIHRGHKPWYWSKGAAATEMVYGKGTYYPGLRNRPMVHQFGLAGEALMNFGLVGPFISFTIWGFLVGRLRRFLSYLRPGDMRLMTAMLLTNMVFVALSGDMDIILYVFIWAAMFPLLVIRIVSRREHVGQGIEIAYEPGFPVSKPQIMHNRV